MISQGFREQVRRARPTITRPTEVSEGPNSTAKATSAREVSYGSPQDGESEENLRPESPDLGRPR